MTDTSHPGLTPDDTGTAPDFDIAPGRVGPERKRAEEALREAQMALAHTNRVATMGQLAASTSMIAAPVEHLPATVIKIPQAVTGEIVLEKLIDGLLRAAVEHAGAERGLLIGQRDDELEIQAEATMSGGDAGRDRAEAALRESEAKFRDFAETASDWFWEIGPDYKFTLLTENAFGSDPAGRIGTACWDHALDLETEPQKWRVVRETLDARRPYPNVREG